MEKVLDCPLSCSLFMLHNCCKPLVTIEMCLEYIIQIYANVIWDLALIALRPKPGNKHFILTFIPNQYTRRNIN